jgi:hypothetical protein
MSSKVPILTSSALAIIIILAVCGAAVAQQADTAALCGPPPSPEVQKEISNTKKADLEGKAQALSKFLGSGEVAGKIESERKSIYQTTNESEAIREEFYLVYMACLAIMGDKTAPLKEKMEFIQALRKPRSQSDQSDKDACAKEQQKWDMAEKIHSLQAYQYFLELYPKCMMGGLARTRIQQIQSGHTLYRCGSGSLADYPVRVGGADPDISFICWQLGRQSPPPPPPTDLPPPSPPRANSSANSPATVASSLFTLRPNMQFNGKIFIREGYPFSAADNLYFGHRSAENCAQICADDIYCKAYTYDKPNRGCFIYRSLAGYKLVEDADHDTDIRH